MVGSEPEITPPVDSRKIFVQIDDINEKFPLTRYHVGKDAVYPMRGIDFEEKETTSRNKMIYPMVFIKPDSAAMKVNMRTGQRIVYVNDIDQKLFDRDKLKKILNDESREEILIDVIEPELWSDALLRRCLRPLYKPHRNKVDAQKEIVTYKMLNGLFD